MWELSTRLVRAPSKTVRIWLAMPKGPWCRSEEWQHKAPLWFQLWTCFPSSGHCGSCPLTSLHRLFKNVKHAIMKQPRGGVEDGGRNINIGKSGRLIISHHTTSNPPRLPWGEQGVGLNDPYRSLTTRDMLCLHGQTQGTWRSCNSSVWLTSAYQACSRRGSSRPRQRILHRDGSSTPEVCPWHTN